MSVSSCSNEVKLDNDETQKINWLRLLISELKINLVFLGIYSLARNNNTKVNINRLFVFPMR